MRYNLRGLPNTDGFEFIGIDCNGKEYRCHVVRDKNMTHYVDGEARYCDLKYWRHKDAVPERVENDE